MEDDLSRRSRRYPRRWIVGRHHASPSSIAAAASSSSHPPPQVARVEDDMAKHEAVFPHKRRKTERHCFCLPSEILFDILLLLPAIPLHDAVRYVCKQFFGIVRDPLFVTSHHRHHCPRLPELSSPGYILQPSHDKSYVYYFEPVDRDSSSSSSIGTLLEVAKLQIPSPGRLIGSFNGLVLLRHWTDLGRYCLVNPVTKVMISLPPILDISNLSRLSSNTAFGLTSSGMYKVVHVSVERCYGISDWHEHKQVWMRVFTVGVDTAWRYIDVKAVINVDLRVYFALGCTPRFIDGFFYWYNVWHYNGVAMEVDTERMYQFSEPSRIYKFSPGVSNFITTEKYLGFVWKRDGLDWRFWKLTDVKKGEWTEMDAIKIDAIHAIVDKHLLPRKLLITFVIRLINDEELWFYRQIEMHDPRDNVVVRYNMVTQRFSFFQVGRIYIDSLIHPHVHTLISP